MENNKQKGSFIALMPLIVFVGLFIGTGVIAGDFEALPLNLAILIASVFAFIMYPKTSLTKKLV